MPRVKIMYSAQNNFEAKLNALRLLYKRDISGKIQELEQAIQDAHHKPDSRSVGHLRFVSHKLAGSGATFGFPEISAEAKKIERFSASYLEALKENPNKQQVWDDVFDSLHQLKSLAENIQGKKESQKPSDEDIEKLKLSAGKPSAAHFANAPAITANTQATPFSDDAILLRLANEHENEASLLLIEDDHIVSRELSTHLGFFGLSHPKSPSPKNFRRPANTHFARSIKRHFNRHGKTRTKQLYQLFAGA